MTVKDDTKRKIAVMQAFLDGKEIEFKSNFETNWSWVNSPTWTWATGEYRVRREPKDYWLCLGFICASRGNAESMAIALNISKPDIIHVREVLDD